MNEGIIAVQQIGGNLWVDARELHGKLEVKTVFRHWVTRRLQESDAIEGEDFRSNLTESLGGRPSQEYRLTLDIAKEFAMLEKNEKGKEIRRYFIG